MKKLLTISTLFFTFAIVGFFGCSRTEVKVKNCKNKQTIKDDSYCFKSRYFLHEAVERNDPKLMNALLDAGFSIEKDNDNGRTPLEYAVELGHLEALQALMARGAEYMGYLRPVNKAFHDAARFGHLNIVKWFIENGEDVENRSDTFGKTVLYESACQGRFPVVDYLLSIGAKINLRNSANKIRSPADCAAQFGNLNMAKYLVEKGAPLKNDWYTGYGPLFLPAEKGYQEVVIWYLGNGADIDRQDKLGESAIFKAIKKNNLDLVKLLVKKGASLKIKSKTRSTPYSLAVKIHKKEIAEYLKQFN